MKRSGRAHWLIVLGLVGLAVVLALFLFSGESPTTVANQFMIALANGDADELTRLTYYKGDKERLREKWKYATTVVAPHYRFAWATRSYVQNGPDQVTVKMEVARDSGDPKRPNPASYPENFEMRLFKEGGRWKVDVGSMARNVYPGLPR